MDDWQILFYPTDDGHEPVKEYIQQLDYDTRHEIIHVFDLLYNQNIRLGLPFSKKINKTGLRELRIWCGPVIYRVLYFAFMGKKFILLHIFKKKTDKTPLVHKQLAIKRMGDYQSRFTAIDGS